MKQTIWYVPCTSGSGTAKTKFFNSRDSYENYAQNNKGSILGDVGQFTVDGNIDGLDLHNDTTANTRQSHQNA
jgi:hypothetical protein